MAQRFRAPSSAVRAGKLRAAVQPWLIQDFEPAIGNSLQDPFALLEVLSRMLALVIVGQIIGHAWWRSPGPGSLIADVGPDAALLHALAEVTVAPRTPTSPMIDRFSLSDHRHRRSAPVMTSGRISSPSQTTSLTTSIATVRYRKIRNLRRR